MTSAAMTERREAIVDGEFAFTNQDFKKIAALLYAQAGISLPETKATLVYSRLAKRLRALGMKTFTEYCAFVALESSVEGESDPFLKKGLQLLVDGAEPDTIVHSTMQLWRTRVGGKPPIGIHRPPPQPHPQPPKR